MSASHINDVMQWVALKDVPPWGEKLEEPKDYMTEYNFVHEMPTVDILSYNFVPHADWRPITRVLKLINASMETGPWIAGGAPLQWYQGQGVGSGDIDIWFRDLNQFERILNLLGNQYSRFFRLDYRTDNAISFTYDIPAQDQTHSRNHYKIQLICKKFFDKPQDIIDYFDFTVCQVVTDGSDLMVGKRTHYDIKHRLLRLSGEINEKIVVRRFTKYLCKGYRPVDGMFSQILELSDTAFEGWGGDDPYDF